MNCSFKQVTIECNIKSLIVLSSSWQQTFDKSTSILNLYPSKLFYTGAIYEFTISYINTFYCEAFFDKEHILSNFSFKMCFFSLKKLISKNCSVYIIQLVTKQVDQCIISWHCVSCISFHFIMYPMPVDM